MDPNKDVEDKTQVDVDKDKSDDGVDKDQLDIDSSSDGDTGATELKGDDAKNFVGEILDEYGLDSADELKEFMGNLAQLKGKIGERDLDQILKNSDTLEKYQRHWERQERDKLKDGETPEETIARLEKENDDLQTGRKKDSEKHRQAQEAEHSYNVFCDTVESTIRSDKSVPREYYPFMAEFMGVENPINEIDINDKQSVRKLTKAGVKKLQKFEQVIIKRYRDGKTSIPKVTSSTETESTKGPGDKAKEPKNLSEARKIFTQSLAGILGKK